VHNPVKTMKVFRNGALDANCRSLSRVEKTVLHPRIRSDGCRFAAQLDWGRSAGPILSYCGAPLGRAFGKPVPFELLVCRRAKEKLCRFVEPCKGRLCFRTFVIFSSYSWVRCCPACTHHLGILQNWTSHQLTGSPLPGDGAPATVLRTYALSALSGDAHF
jgi:hypothetical protein